MSPPLTDIFPLQLSVALVIVDSAGPAPFHLSGYRPVLRIFSAAFPDGVARKR